MDYPAIQPIQELSCLCRTAIALLEMHNHTANGILADQWDMNLAVSQADKTFPRMFLESGKYTLIRDLDELYGIGVRECERNDIDLICEGLQNGIKYIVSINPKLWYTWYQRVADLDLPYHVVLLLDYNAKTNLITYWDSRAGGTDNRDLYREIERDRLAQTLYPHVVWALDLRDANPLPIEEMIRLQFTRVLMKMRDNRTVRLFDEDIFHGLAALHAFAQEVETRVGDLENRTQWRKAMYCIMRTVAQREVFLQKMKHRLRLDDNFCDTYLSKWRYMSFLLGKKDGKRMQDYLEQVTALEETLSNSVEDCLFSSIYES
ncbi:hypothetical protein [Alicyclobacillus fodiniaquatilis]|uniref:Butirosin biosynthesis protein H N-terminal domain-containing protein n=1 Tax=Alicyclobacillus fodiniaquatilis TaxID=1661150 RepID=A0ABW4JC86_9BACL